MEFISRLSTKITEGFVSEHNLPYWISGRLKFIDTTISDKLKILTSNCPGLVRLNDVTEDLDGIPQLHYEFIENALDLSFWIHKTKFKINESDLETVFEILFLMTEGTVQLHKYSIVHRDISITNFFVNEKSPHPEKSIKLGDLELAIFSGQQNSDYAINAFETPSVIDLSGAGTEGFSPPEQYSAKSIVTEKFDQYAIAMNLIYVLTGGKVDPRLESVDSVQVVMEEPIKNIYGEKTLRILQKATSRDPEKRYQSVLQFRVALISSIIKHLRTEI